MLVVDDIKVVLEMLLQEVKVVLGRQFVGMYIHGSLASGDFEPETSDVDFVVVTSAQLGEDMVTELAHMHEKIRASGMIWAQRLEGSYISRDDLRILGATSSNHPALNIDGSFALDTHGGDWVIQRCIIREYGITLEGPPPRDLIHPVSPEELRKAVRVILKEWWSEPLPSPDRFGSAEYRAYAVLTMCRAMFTVNHGQVCTKPEASHWALGVVDERWMPLIDWALRWRPGHGGRETDETLEFLRYVGAILLSKH